MKTTVNFTGSGKMNIAQGKNAIASQVNTIVQQVSTSGNQSPAIRGKNVVITYSEDSKSRTVVSQQIQG